MGAYPRRDTHRYAAVRILITLLDQQHTPCHTHPSAQVRIYNLVRIRAVRHDFKGKYLSFRIKAYRAGAYHICKA